MGDRPVLGILLMLGFCLLAPLGDALVKLLGSVPVLMILMIRYGVQALIAPVLLLSGRPLGMTPRILRLTALRTLLHVTAFAIFVTALRYLPLADAIAIAYVMPFILLILGSTFLGEEVGPRRIAACAVGFIGTLMVIQPSFAEVGPPALLPVVVAVLFAVFMLVTRRIAKEADPFALQGVSGVMATLLLTVIWLLPLDHAQVQLVAPEAGQWVLLIAAGLLGTGAHLLMTASLRFAPSATLAPMQYLEIPFATAIGWAIFSDLPNTLAGAGIAVTVGAGLYILWREHVTARADRKAA